MNNNGFQLTPEMIEKLKGSLNLNPEVEQTTPQTPIPPQTPITPDGLTPKVPQTPQTTQTTQTTEIPVVGSLAKNVNVDDKFVDVMKKGALSTDFKTPFVRLGENVSAPSVMGSGFSTKNIIGREKEDGRTRELDDKISPETQVAISIFSKIFGGTA